MSLSGLFNFFIYYLITIFKFWFSTCSFILSMTMAKLAPLFEEKLTLSNSFLVLLLTFLLQFYLIFFSPGFICFLSFLVFWEFILSVNLEFKIFFIFVPNTNWFSTFTKVSILICKPCSCILLQPILILERKLFWFLHRQKELISKF